MAKPILPSRLQADMPVGVAAGRLLDAKRAEVLKFVEPALTGDVDGIHDLRIAVKRLRETMRLFRPLFPRRRGRELLALVDQLNDGLGAVRDRDVLGEHAEALRTEAPEAEALLTGLQGVWSGERSASLLDLQGLWERLAKTERLGTRLGELARLTRRRQRPPNLTPLDRFAYAAVTLRLERVNLHLRETGDQSEASVLHRLRILVKRLKYGMEPFLPALPALEGPYTPVADLQESLGLAHDLDILSASLQAHARQVGLKAPLVLDLIAVRRQATCETAMGQLGVLRSDAWRRSLLDALD